MRKRKAKNGETILHLKAIQSDRNLRVRGYPYRVLTVPGNLTLYALAEAILTSFDFYFDHAFGFYEPRRDYFSSREGYELFRDMGEESMFKSVKRTKTGKVFNEHKKKMLFYFDYGDSWYFIVQLVETSEAQGGEVLPAVVRTEGKALPQYPPLEGGRG